MTQPSPTDKLTDALIKLLFAGSGGYALYSLYTDDLPKAAILGLVSAMAALMTSFGQGLMGQLTSSMKTRGEKVGQFVDQTLENTVDITWARISQSHKQYLEALKAQCYAVEIEGFQDLPALALEEVFVPLRIESDQNQLGFGDGPKEIWDFLPQRYQTPGQFPHRRLVILAAPGYGKTTLMRHLTLIFVSRPPADKPEFMPILLRFREIYSLMHGVEAAETPTMLSLPGLITRHIANQPEFKASPPSRNWLTDQLDQGRCLVMLDGLDEVPKTDRQAVRQWVDQQMKRYDKTQFILTSRPHGFELQPDDPSYPIQVDLKLKVLDFNTPQKQTFVEKWYRTVFWRMKWEPLLQRSQQSTNAAPLTEENARQRSHQEADEAAGDLIRQIVNSPSLNDLARNPLLVTMIASTHRSQTVLPKRRVELYDKIFDLLLGTRPYVKKTALTLTASENKAVLQVLAWQLVNAEITQFTPQQGAEWIEESLQRCVKNRLFTAYQFLTEMTDIAGLLVEKELGYLEFAHQTFQEYLAARYLREQTDVEDLLKAKLTNDRWEEVARFYCALGDATEIIEALLLHDDQYTLFLASKCADEGRGVEPDTFDKLQTALVNLSFQGKPTFNREVAEAQLLQRFQNLLRFSENAEITINPINWNIYFLFLNAQHDGLFHSSASTGQIRMIHSIADEDFLEEDIRWEDARWFCAWLSSLSILKMEGKVFNYRLPTKEEIEQMPALDLRERQPWTADASQPGNALLVVREELPDRYGELVNYLANGLWREADKETYQVMRQVMGGKFTSQGLREFPCEDLRIIDQLWVKFSGGKFGFSIQKQIYADCGAKLDGSPPSEKVWYDFCDRVGWRMNDSYREYDQLIADPEKSPTGEFPFEEKDWIALFSRIQTCKL